MGTPIRADEINYVPLERVSLDGAMAIVGISTLGSVGSLVARYLISHLDMRLVGAFYSEHLFPAGASHHGVMTSTVQVWRAEVACGPDGRCQQLLVVKNDLPVDLPAMAPLSKSVSRWAADNNVALLVGCESYPRPAESTDREVLVAASGPARELPTRLTAAKRLDDAIVVGFDAALLASANQDDVRAIVLFGPHRHPDGDSQAAAAALRAASPLLPDLALENVDLDRELQDLEEELERQLRAAMEGGRLGRGLKGYA